MPLPSWYAPLLSDSVAPNHRQTSFHNITQTRGRSLHDKSRALLGKSGNLQAKLNIQTIGRLPWYGRHPLLSNAAIFKRSSSKYRHLSFNYTNVKLEVTTENVSAQFKWCSIIFSLDLPHCLPLFFAKKSWPWLYITHLISIQVKYDNTRAWLEVNTTAAAATTTSSNRPQNIYTKKGELPIVFFTTHFPVSFQFYYRQEKEYGKVAAAVVVVYAMKMGVPTSAKNKNYLFLVSSSQRRRHTLFPLLPIFFTGPSSYVVFCARLLDTSQFPCSRQQGSDDKVVWRFRSFSIFLVFCLNFFPHAEMWQSKSMLILCCFYSVISPGSPRQLQTDGLVILLHVSLSYHGLKYFATDGWTM